MVLSGCHLRHPAPQTVISAVAWRRQKRSAPPATPTISTGRRIDVSGPLASERTFMDFFLGLPLGWAIAALFGGAMIRSNATYWLGRGVAAGCRHTRLEKHLDGPLMRRAEAMTARFGPFAVTLCFLTVG